MSQQIKQILLKALDAHRGDDLERAKAATRHLTPEQMNAPWGASGQTAHELLAAYQAHVDRVEEARRWVLTTLGGR